MRDLTNKYIVKGHCVVPVRVQVSAATKQAACSKAHGSAKYAVLQGYRDDKRTAKGTYFEPSSVVAVEDGTVTVFDGESADDYFARNPESTDASDAIGDNTYRILDLTAEDEELPSRDEESEEVAND